MCITSEECAHCGHPVAKVVALARVTMRCCIVPGLVPEKSLVLVSSMRVCTAIVRRQFTAMLSRFVLTEDVEGKYLCTSSSGFSAPGARAIFAVTGRTVYGE